MSAEDILVAPLRAHDLSFRYGRISVLRGLSFEVRPGMIWALVGANGAGKTTLFSILAGLAQPQEGRVEFGASPVDERTVRARISVVAHEPQAYARLSARENLALFADLAAADDRSTRSVERSLARFGLRDAADRSVGDFSRGMAQRVALARAFMRTPDIYLLDEPFTALDRAGKALLSEVLREETRRGAAVILASHDFPWICEVADEVAWLSHGRIEAKLDPAAQGTDAALATMRSWLQGASPSA